MQFLVQVSVLLSMLSVAVSAGVATDAVVAPEMFVGKGSASTVASSPKGISLVPLAKTESPQAAAPHGRGFLVLDRSDYGGPYCYNSNIRETIPLGTCVENLITSQGRFVKLYVDESRFGGLSVLEVHEFDDGKCRTRRAQPFRSFVNFGVCNNGVVLSYSPSKPWHNMGLVNRTYGGPNCRGKGHIDTWYSDGNCYNRQLWNPNTWSFIANCVDGYVVEFSGSSCSGESFYKDLDSNVLGVCDSSRGPSAEFICGGWYDSSTPYPTMQPTPLPEVTYIEVPNWDSVFNATAVSNDRYHYHWTNYGNVTGREVVVSLLSVSGDADLFVKIAPTGASLDCNVGTGCYDCFSATGGIAADQCYLNNVFAFNQYCLSEPGCDIYIGVRAFLLNSEYSLGLLTIMP